MTTSLVIGAAGGVGIEVARNLAKRGQTVIGTVLNTSEEKLLREQVPEVEQIRHVDLGSAENVLTRITDIAGGLDRLDNVAVCAGISPLKHVEAVPLAQLRKVLEINTVSHLAVFQAVMPRLRQSKGRLLFMSSMSGRIGSPFTGAYTASKFALEGLADVMRQEAAPFGVKVILVEPGGIRTGMVKAQLEQVERDIAGLSPEADKLFGHLYRGFQAAASRSYNESAGSTAEQVAAIVEAALTSPDPETRYIAGDDAKQLLAARQAMSDRDFDALLAQFFAAA